MGLCGPSQQEQQAQALAQQQAQTLQQNYTTLFGQQQQTLNTLNSYIAPLMNGKGLDVQGYTPDALAAMRTSATDQNAAAGANALEALQVRQQQEGLGNPALPTGVTLKQAAGLESAEQFNNAQSQNQITLANYQQGVQNYLAGLGSTANEAGLVGSSASSTAANFTPTETAAFNQANTMASQSFNFGKLLAGALGFAATFIPGVGPALGAIIGNASGVPVPGAASTGNGTAPKPKSPTGSAPASAGSIPLGLGAEIGLGVNNISALGG